MTIYRASPEAPLPVLRLSRSEALRLLWPKSDLQLAYRAPSKAERVKLARLVSLLFSLSSPDDPQVSEAQKLADELKFQLAEWTIRKRHFWALTERPKHRRGAGSYLIRMNGKKRPNVLLQVPHAYFELRIREVALDVLLSSEGRYINALFTNSLHRYQSEPGLRDPRDDSPADASHADDHWFQIATEASLQEIRRPYVIQLHGFAETAEDSLGETYAIISGGDREAPTRLAEEFAFEVREHFGRGALLFPVDTNRLGGTLNVQRKSVVERPNGQFLHIELGREFRNRIANGDEEGQRFGNALRTAIDSADEAK